MLVFMDVVWKKTLLPKYIESDNKNPRRSLHQGPKKKLFPKDPGMS